MSSPPFPKLLTLSPLPQILWECLDMLCDQPLHLTATTTTDSTADAACLDVCNHGNTSIKLTFRGALLHPHTRPLPHGPCEWTRTVAASPFDVKLGCMCPDLTPNSRLIYWAGTSALCGALTMAAA